LRAHARASLIYSADAFSPTRSNQSRTFPFQNRKSIAAIALSPDGNVLISIDDGACRLVSLAPSGVLMHLHRRSRAARQLPPRRRAPPPQLPQARPRRPLFARRPPHRRLARRARPGMAHTEPPRARVCAVCAPPDVHRPPRQGVVHRVVTRLKVRMPAEL
jgi:hypothetical protein